MSVAIKKSVISNAKRAKLKDYRDRLDSSEAPHRMADAMVSGFDDGWRALLHVLVDEGVIQWVDEPIPGKEVKNEGSTTA